MSTFQTHILIEVYANLTMVYCNRCHWCFRHYLLYQAKMANMVLWWYRLAFWKDSPLYVFPLHFPCEDGEGSMLQNVVGFLTSDNG